MSARPLCRGNAGAGTGSRRLRELLFQGEWQLSGGPGAGVTAPRVLSAATASLGAAAGRRGVDRAPASPLGAAGPERFPGLVETLECLADPGRRGGLGAGEEQALPWAGPGQAGAVLRPRARRAGTRFSARVSLRARRGIICWKAMPLPTLPWQGGDLQFVTGFLIGL